MRCQHRGAKAAQVAAKAQMKSSDANATADEKSVEARSKASEQATDPGRSKGRQEVIASSGLSTIAAWTECPSTAGLPQSHGVARDGES